MSFVFEPKSSGFPRFTRDHVSALLDEGRLPSVKTASKETFPVDDVGFVFTGKRWEIESFPNEDHIEQAKKNLTNAVPCGGARGASKSVALSEIKAKLEDRFDVPYVTNGAMILAAAKLGWTIRQENINGIVFVSRKWWNSLG